MSKDGLLLAKNAIIYGTTYSSAGLIGGWTIANGNLHTQQPDDNTSGVYLYSTDQGDNNKKEIGASGSIGTWRITAGNSFGVDKYGNIYATSANLTGVINATSGTIGDSQGKQWHIGSSTGANGYSYLYASNNNNLPNSNNPGIYIGTDKI